MSAAVDVDSGHQRDLRPFELTLKTRHKSVLYFVKRNIASNILTFWHGGDSLNAIEMFAAPRSATAKPPHPCE
jgi:hypothetical protein